MKKPRAYNSAALDILVITNAFLKYSCLLGILGHIYYISSTLIVTVEPRVIIKCK